jgi:hypothetical protein
MCILLMAGAPLAVDAKQHTIAVLDSVNQLLYGSLSVPSDRQVSVEVLRNGERFSMTADCQNGRLNGSDPSSSMQPVRWHSGLDEGSPQSKNIRLTTLPMSSATRTLASNVSLSWKA